MSRFLFYINVTIYRNVIIIVEFCTLLHCSHIVLKIKILRALFFTSNYQTSEQNKRTEHGLLCVRFFYLDGFSSSLDSWLANISCIRSAIVGRSCQSEAFFILYITSFVNKLLLLSLYKLVFCFIYICIKTIKARLFSYLTSIL